MGVDPGLTWRAPAPALQWVDYDDRLWEDEKGNYFTMRLEENTAVHVCNDGERAGCGAREHAAAACVQGGPSVLAMPLRVARPDQPSMGAAIPTHLQTGSASSRHLWGSCKR
jgi:hypothetical protein